MSYINLLLNIHKITLIYVEITEIKNGYNVTIILTVLSVLFL